MLFTLVKIGFLPGSVLGVRCLLPVDIGTCVTLYCTAPNHQRTDSGKRVALDANLHDLNVDDVLVLRRKCV